MFERGYYGTYLRLKIKKKVLTRSSSCLVFHWVMSPLVLISEPVVLGHENYLFKPQVVCRSYSLYFLHSFHVKNFPIRKMNSFHFALSEQDMLCFLQFWQLGSQNSSSNSFFTLLRLLKPIAERNDMLKQVQNPGKWDSHKSKTIVQTLFHAVRATLTSKSSSIRKG